MIRFPPSSSSISTRITEDSMNLLHRLWLLLVRIHNLVRDGLAAALSCVLGAPGVKGCPGLG